MTSPQVRSGARGAGAVVVGAVGFFSTVAVTASGPARTGLASGVLNTSRQAGMSVAIALLGALLASPASVAGFHSSLVAVTVSFVAVTALALAWIPGDSIDHPVVVGPLPHQAEAPTGSPTRFESG